MSELVINIIRTLNPKRFKKKDAPVLSAFSFLGPAFTTTATEEIGCSVETVTT